jgi:putative toxin-antitoxin system antitoxin component (TIGR02293 family)
MAVEKKVSATRGKQPKVKAAYAVATKRGRESAWSFAKLYEFDSMQRVQVIKQGLPATMPGAIAQRMGISKDRLYVTLGLPRATVERKARESRPLSPEESSRVLGMGRLVGQVQRMVEESGRPEGFDAAAWVARWMEKAVPALGGMKPAELMDTAEGQQLVANVLSRSQTGAYS